jgi:hypothetical protein
MSRQQKRSPKQVLSIEEELAELASDPTLRPYNFLEHQPEPIPVEPTPLETTPVVITPVIPTPVKPTLVRSFRPALEILSKIPTALEEPASTPVEITDQTGVVFTGVVSTGVEPTRVEPTGIVTNKQRELYEPTGAISTGVVTTPVETSRVGLGGVVSLKRGRVYPLKVKEAKIVQDGHTASEQVVYDFMWRTATPLNANIRSIRIGMTGISNGTGISDSTVKAAVGGLLHKLAIERVGNQDWVLGFEYYVHSWSSCLTRRKAAGLTHVIKSKGVIFVHPETGNPITGSYFRGAKGKPTGVTTTGVGSTQIQETTGVDPTGGRGVEKAITTPVGSTLPPYNQLENQNIITTIRLREELEKYTSTDESGIKTLIQKVKDNAPDATWEELEHFIQEKGEVLKRVKITRSSFGFLLNAIPKCFESPSFQIWRQGREVAAQAEQILQERSEQFLEVQHLRAVLINPTASPEEKHAAKEILEALGEGN